MVSNEDLTKLTTEELALRVKERLDNAIYTIIKVKEILEGRDEELGAASWEIRARASLDAIAKYGKQYAAGH